MAFRELSLPRKGKCNFFHFLVLFPFLFLHKVVDASYPSGPGRKPNTTVLLKEHRNKMTPNDILFTHRSVSCSAIIREALSCGQWEKQNHITGQHVEILEHSF